MNANERTREAYEQYAHAVHGGISKAVAFQVNVEAAIRAAENEALERAARVAERCAVGREEAHSLIARQIRSLKEPTPGT